MAFAFRYVMVILLSVGLAIIYGLKVNLSVAIVSMINHTAVNDKQEEDVAVYEDPCGLKENNSEIVTEDGPFEWSTNMQGNLLSSYFWGYLIIMFPGSQLAENLSAKWVYFSAGAINIACTLAIPFSCNMDYGLVYAVRVIQGLGGGLTFPTTHVLLAHWAPPNERGLMGSIAFSGSILGVVLSNYFSGFTAIHFGWEWVFYSQGTLSIIWLILWAIFAGDRPHSTKFVSKGEREYIETSLGEVSHGKVKHKVPWLSILKSGPFWTILITHTCSTWAFYMLLMNMPLYYKRVMLFSLKQTSLYAAIPYFLMWIFSMIIGEVIDTLRKKNLTTVTFARKLATGIATAPVIACLLTLTFFSCNKVLSVILLTVSLTAMGAMYSGFLTNHIDIANNFAGTLMGLTNTFATIPGIVGPVFVGVITHNDRTIMAWRIIFYVTCGFLLIELVVFSIFGTGEEQHWNKPHTEAINQPTTE